MALIGALVDVVQDIFFLIKSSLLETQAMSDTGDVPQPEPAGSQFLSRIHSLPAIVSLWDTATRTYSHVKHSNSLVSSAFRVVEKTATVVAELGKPVALGMFSSQLSYADALAIRNLDKIVEVYPDVAKKQAKEIVADAIAYCRGKIAGAHEYGRAKVGTVCRSLSLFPTAAVSFSRAPRSAFSA